MPHVLKIEDPKDKLVPLRRFAKAGLYSQNYLSTLVQRGRLKSKQVGRNHFTSWRWFSEYLDCHAREEVRDEYRRLFDMDPGAHLPIDTVTTHAGVARTGTTHAGIAPSASLRTGRYAPTVHIWRRFALAAASLFLFLGVSYVAVRAYVRFDARQGTVSGESETVGEAPPPGQGSRYSATTTPAL